MNVKFNGKSMEVRQLNTYAGKTRLNDLIVGPQGILLKVVTVQTDCPVWESNRKTFTAMLVQTEDGIQIPLRPSGKISILRPRKTR